ncbi:hypothetical protein FQR65_LT12245 [Abscondita terminalis]|nr:hypothetical protein FQR65_LT12245 [Abscondita terminalis]
MGTRKRKSRIQIVLKEKRIRKQTISNERKTALRIELAQRTRICDECNDVMEENYVEVMIKNDPDIEKNHFELIDIEQYPLVKEEVSSEEFVSVSFKTEHEECIDPLAVERLTQPSNDRRNDEKFRCELCNYLTSKLNAYKMHMYKHSGVLPFTCEKCDYKTHSAGILNKHLKSHSEIKPFKCNLCDYRSNYLSDLKKHFYKHSGEWPYRCANCDYKTHSRSNLEAHIRGHTGDKPFKCDLCDYRSSYASKLNKHKCVHYGACNFKCNECHYKTSVKDDLIEHKKQHAGERKFKCDLCKFHSNYKNRIDAHMYKHSGDWPFECDECDYKTHSRTLLVKHKRWHVDGKPFKCEQCDYNTESKSKLIRHALVHTQEKPFKCNLCDYSSNQTNHLKLHMYVHTSERPFKCDECTFKTTEKTRLLDHKRTHSGEKPFECKTRLNEKHQLHHIEEFLQGPSTRARLQAQFYEMNYESKKGTTSKGKHGRVRLPMLVDLLNTDTQKHLFVAPSRSLDDFLDKVNRLEKAMSKLNPKPEKDERLCHCATIVRKGITTETIQYYNDGSKGKKREGRAESCPALNYVRTHYV